jgi:hypothetical protein
MPPKPSNSDLQGQINRMRDDNTKQHDEMKVELHLMRATFDTLAPVIAAHEERLKDCEKTNTGLQGQIQVAVGIGVTVVLAMVGWFLSHLSSK